MSSTQVISCEHASRAVPPGELLGLDPADLAGHHAWDEGAAELAEALSRALGAPLCLGEVSRLVVDLNRAEANPQVIPAESFGLQVPGNRRLAIMERERRLARYHRPYRARVRAAVEAALAARGRCLHLSVHSFSAVLSERRREVEVGVLFDPARPSEVGASEALLGGLRERGWDARPNDPYLGTDDGLTTWLRAELDAPSYAGLELEASSDLVAAGRLGELGRDLAALLGELR